MIKTRNKDREPKRMHPWEIVWSEFPKTNDRIGETTEDCLKWFLRFVYKDPENLSLGEWSDLQFDLARIIHIGPGLSIRHDIFRYAEFWYEAEDPIKSMNLVLTKEFVSSIIKTVQAHISNVLDGKITDASFSELTLALYPPTPPERNKWYLHSVPNDLMDPIVLTLFICLQDNGHRLRRCNECGLVFLAGRKNQIFCSHTCQTRVASRKYLDTPEHRKGKRGRPPLNSKFQSSKRRRNG